MLEEQYAVVRVLDDFKNQKNVTRYLAFHASVTGARETAKKLANKENKRFLVMQLIGHSDPLKNTRP